MKYVGIQSQISSNNTKSMLLLIAFPIILLGMTWVFLATINYFSTGYYDQAGYFVNQLDADSVNWTFTQVAPFIVGGVAIWFAIAYFSNTKMIQHATGAQPLMRSKYCIRFELGLCPRFQRAKDTGPLFLLNNGRRLELGFDCRACEMTVR